jgi:hypothetical protein
MDRQPLEKSASVCRQLVAVSSIDIDYLCSFSVTFGPFKIKRKGLPMLEDDVLLFDILIPDKFFFIEEASVV